MCARRGKCAGGASLLRSALSACGGGYQVWAGLPTRRLQAQIPEEGPSRLNPTSRISVLLNRPIPILMPDNALPETAGVAYLVASHPKEGGTWKEIYVYRHFKCVHIYNVHSYGRRWYRSLWFTTDVRFTLRELTPCTGSRCRNPPMLFRRAAAAGVSLCACRSFYCPACGRG